VVVEIDDGDVITLSLPNKFLANYVNENFYPILVDVLGRELEIIQLEYYQRADWLEARKKNAQKTEIA
jgi:chromosomal replication initiation ATPase DnaA